MAKKHKTEQRIDEIRNKINNIADQISKEKSITEIIRENPAGSVITILITGVLTAILSRNIIKLALKLFSFGIKASAFFFFIKKSMPYLSKLKK